MFGKKKNRPTESQLDELGIGLVGGARASDDEVEAAISSPFLYSRIKAAIASGKQAPAEAPGGWLGLLRAARFAVPAMALLTIVAGSLPWLESSMSRKVPSVAVTQTDPDVVASFAAGACALSNSEECAVSSNEVLATIFAEENQEQQR